MILVQQLYAHKPSYAAYLQTLGRDNFSVDMERNVSWSCELF